MGVHFGLVQQLADPEAMVSHLNAALKDGDPAVVGDALVDIARARGLELDGDTAVVFGAILQVLGELGVKLQAVIG